ncbi:methyl-accepting chemotaxis protein [Pseudomonas lalucatii]|uniref:Methyl-accepting chemotaxis protein n=2 Tax=Pseudomonas lalucatii TaxID=1424203 RepID=A0ABS5Q076_9PSED|nr:methyl-accepting chemotaxis protein [Pseudomonas lalucatii]MBS7662156.1 methyl-accepting chemotaxis protein [Pseudomonas lalucatii]MBS7726077.1 methyl-accepting chemotaxis protein [Pseudomonas lalucatii]QVM88351.1 methyl-accepting chemotaxis protein [Pseudomonas lalucatii]
MRLWQRSIQWQLILSMGAALLASILIVVLIYSALVNRLAERYLVEEALPASVLAIRNDLERVLAEPLTAARGIAENSLVADWLSSGEDAARREAFARYLAGVQGQQKALTTFIVSLDSGNYFTGEGLKRSLQRGPADNAWFYGFVDSGKARSLDIDIDQSSRQPTLFINQRVAVGGKTLGVAGLGFSLGAMSEMIRDFRFGEDGRVYLVSADGRVKVHPESAFNDSRELSQLVGAEAAAGLLGKSREALRFERDGATFLAIAQPLQALDWLLVSEIPEAEIYAEARQAMFTSSLIGVAVALLFLGLVVLLARGLVRPIRQVTAALVEIGGGGGDLTRRLDESRGDELGDLARGFNRFIASQRSLIGDVLATSERLRGAVGQVAQVVENTAGRAGRQQEMTDMVATAVHEMGLTVQEIARNASSAAQASHEARDEAQQARQVVGQSIAHIERMSTDIGGAAEAVGELANQVASIDQVLAVIRGISEQTNLLALNAAIEAARAGEMGRGFAVVADEVRTLASRTQSSTDEIQEMIQRLKQGAETAVSSMHAGQAATGTGVQASQRTGQSLGAITEQVERISDMNTQVAAATEEQSSVTEEINRNVQGIADLAHATAGEVLGCREDCQSLRALAEDLAKQMGSFRL